MADTALVPHAHFAVATVGSRSAQGGFVVTGCEEVRLQDRPVACVGDHVRYPDGREATLVTGASRVFCAGRSVALMGSQLDNGDVLVESTQMAALIREPAQPLVMTVATTEVA